MLAILKAIALGAVQALVGKLIELWRDHQLNEARKRAAEAEARLAAARAVSEDEARLAEVVKSHEAATAKVTTYEEKLKWIHDFNER